MVCNDKPQCRPASWHELLSVLDGHDKRVFQEQITFPHPQSCPSLDFFCAFEIDISHPFRRLRVAYRVLFAWVNKSWSDTAFCTFPFSWIANWSNWSAPIDLIGPIDLLFKPQFVRSFLPPFSTWIQTFSGQFRNDYSNFSALPVSRLLLFLKRLLDVLPTQTLLSKLLYSNTM